jgi:putrescine importer
VTATALINFGALIAFTFVSLGEISYYVIREKKHRTFKGCMNYLIFPFIGAGTLVALWINLELSSLELLGIVWAAIGICYLLYKTNMFRSLPPQLEYEEMIEM